MPCPECGSTLRRIKSNRNECKFEDLDHNYPRVKCINCEGRFYLSENTYHSSERPGY